MPPCFMREGLSLMVEQSKVLTAQMVGATLGAPLAGLLGQSLKGAPLPDFMRELHFRETLS